MTFLRSLRSLTLDKLCNDRIPWVPDDHDDAVADGFPFFPTKMPHDELCARIRAQLPPYPRATALVEAYLENFSWFFRPIDREQIVEDLLPATYAWARASASSAETGVEAPEMSVQQLGLMLAVFACGATADLTLSPDNEEASAYHCLAKVVLSQENLFGAANLDTVQAIAMLGAHDLYRCTKNSLEFSWKMVSFALILASSVSQHVYGNVMDDLKHNFYYTDWTAFVTDSTH